MLFNSYEFLFVFLPLTLLGFLLLGRASRGLALSWLILASLGFYAWWRPRNVPILAVSMLVNYMLATAMVRMSDVGGKARTRTALLVSGIAFNVLFLGYFKYTNFFLSAVGDLTGTNFVFRQVILPLGISFITFQKIAFLIDVHARRVEAFTARSFMLFVLFFPQLIAGPIVHYRQMMPQFERSAGGAHGPMLAMGLTLLCMGLFKKVVLADGIAAHITPVYELAQAGGAVSLLPGWAAALGFTLQIYFDFSGYSSMAAGVACCFRVRLPLNFYSPLQASSIIDFWLRWHVTLTQFLTAYVYNPLLLWLTRRRMARGLAKPGGHASGAGAFLQLLAGPTLLTMLLSGLWHGAGYTFLLWGLLHGLYLVINHAWRITGARLWKDRERYVRFMRPIGLVLTLLAVTVAMVLFRAPTVGAAMEVYRGMLGLRGLELPGTLAARLAGMGVPGSLFRGVDVDLTSFFMPFVWVLGLLAIALLMPNTLQIMARFEPVLGIKERPPDIGLPWLRVFWRPAVHWWALIALLGAIAVMRLGGPSEFLYWQF